MAIRTIDPVAPGPAAAPRLSGKRSAAPAAGTARPRAHLLGIIALLLGLLAPASAGAEPESALTRFAGSWRWVGGAGELRAIDDAIEGCVKQMNIFIRGIARRRIRKPLQPSPELAFAVAGPSLAIIRPDRPTMALPANGQPIRWRDPGGDWFVITLGFDRSTLYQRFEGTSSISLNSYILDPTGRQLTVHTRIVSKRLPAPIEFNTTYQKSP